MSKRLQVLIPEEEFKRIAHIARRRKRSTASLVREGLQYVLRLEQGRPAAERIAAILYFSRFSAPTADIEQMLAEIEQGRGNDDLH